MLILTQEESGFLYSCFMSAPTEWRKTRIGKDLQKLFVQFLAVQNNGEHYMSRAIRRVPANWKHPKDSVGRFIPMSETPYAKAEQEWQKEVSAYDPDKHEGASFEEFYGERPSKDCYIEYDPKDAPWWQAYEETSLGTPVTPPFASKEELIEHLMDYGMKHYKSQMSKEAAEKFVEMEWLPTGMILDGTMYNSQEAAQALSDKKL